MTSAEKLAILQNLTGESNQTTLSTYLFLAEQAVLSRAFPFGEETKVPAKYDGVHIEIAQYMLNKRGAEGEKTHTENGISRQYENGDIPSYLLQRITPMVSVLGSDGGQEDASDEA